MTQVSFAIFPIFLPCMFLIYSLDRVHWKDQTRPKSAPQPDMLPCVVQATQIYREWLIWLAGDLKFGMGGRRTPRSFSDTQWHKNCDRGEGRDNICGGNWEGHVDDGLRFRSRIPPRLSVIIFRPFCLFSFLFIVFVFLACLSLITSVGCHRLSPLPEFLWFWWLSYGLGLP